MIFDQDQSNCSFLQKNADKFLKSSIEDLFYFVDSNCMGEWSSLKSIRLKYIIISYFDINDTLILNLKISVCTRELTIGRKNVMIVRRLLELDHTK